MRSELFSYCHSRPILNGKWCQYVPWMCAVTVSRNVEILWTPSLEILGWKNYDCVMVWTLPFPWCVLLWWPSKGVSKYRWFWKHVRLGFSGFPGWMEGNKWRKKEKIYFWADDWPNFFFQVRTEEDRKRQGWQTSEKGLIGWKTPQRITSTTWMMCESDWRVSLSRSSGKARAN